MIAIVIRENGADAYHYVYSDHLGSLLTITNSNGSVEVEQNFDAWGRRRNPTNWSYYALPTPPDWLYRGFTGHEMLDPFVLINMNGRIYDPVVARVLSPDNFVQDPFSTQGYNRYSYGYNNPLKYTDPDGQIIPLVFLAAAVIGGGLNVAAHWGKIHSLQDGLIAFGIGAGAGLLTAATGGAAATTAGLAAASVGGGAVAGAVGAAFGGALQGIGNALYFGDSFGAREWLTGIALGAGSGAALGGIAGWIRNLRNPASGHNLWTGAPQAEGTGVFSFRNGRELLEQGWQRVDGRWWNSLGGGSGGNMTFQNADLGNGQVVDKFAGMTKGKVIANLSPSNSSSQVELIFTETLREGNLIFYSTRIGEDVIEFGGTFSKSNRILTIQDFDIDGSITNKLGLRGIKNVINDFGRQQDVDQVIIQGAKRTTGANPGKLPSRLIFKIQK